MIVSRWTGFVPHPYNLRTAWAGHQMHVFFHIFLLNAILSTAPTVVPPDTTEIFQVFKRDDVRGSAARRREMRVRGEFGIVLHPRLWGGQGDKRLFEQADVDIRSVRLGRVRFVGMVGEKKSVVRCLDLRRGRRSRYLEQFVVVSSRRVGHRHGRSGHSPRSGAVPRDQSITSRPLPVPFQLCSLVLFTRGKGKRSVEK